jgi:hypothetical protein
VGSGGVLSVTRLPPRNMLARAEWLFNL